MPYPIDKKLVIAIASSALFDLSESNRVFKEKGITAYKKYQERNIDKVLDKGVAFPFIKRFLNINNSFPRRQPVEVILLSRNSPETGMRVFRSIREYGLNITRAGFFSGESPHKYIPSFNTSLFLSANADDVNQAIKSGIPAGRVIETSIVDDEEDMELRIAFDFDGVLADDSAEKVFKTTKDLGKFHESETQLSLVPHNPGPLLDLFTKISFFQKLELKKLEKDTDYKRLLKISIITARNAPSHERMIRTLNRWGVSVDETFFLGGIEKKRILEVMKPHIYFDDQQKNLDHINNIPLVHVPFGIINENTF